MNELRIPMLIDMIACYGIMLSIMLFRGDKLKKRHAAACIAYLIAAAAGLTATGFLFCLVGWLQTPLWPAITNSVLDVVLLTLFIAVRGNVAVLYSGALDVIEQYAEQAKAVFKRRS